MGLTFTPRKVRLLGFVIAFLVIAHLGTIFARFVLGKPSLLGLVPLFDLDTEANAPTLFSTFLFGVNALLAFLIGAKLRKQGSGDARYWLFLGGVLLFLGIDESALVHELLIEPLRLLLGTSGVLYYAWIIPYGLAGLVIGLVYLRFIWKLTPRVRLLIFVAAGLYVAGALGMEMIGGFYVDHLHATTVEELDALYYLFVAVEETLEMVGLTVLIYAFMTYIDSVLGGVELRIGSATEETRQPQGQEAVRQSLTPQPDPQGSRAR